MIDFAAKYMGHIQTVVLRLIGILSAAILFCGQADNVSGTKPSSLPITIFSPKSRDELKFAVSECLKQAPKGSCPDTKYGPIQRWDVSDVTNMSALFLGGKRQPFNADISRWHVSSAVDMSNMFRGLSFFNQNISGWDVSRVTSMRAMFYQGSSFNANISHWDVSRVNDMSSMFYYASSFKADISEWNVEHVTNMAGMFEHANSFNSDISRWQVSRVENTSKMFYRANEFNADISKWDVSRVKDMTWMLYKAQKFSRQLCGHWITSKANGRDTLFKESTATLCPPKTGSDGPLDTPLVIGLSVSISLVAGIVVVGMVGFCVHRRSKNNDKNTPGADANALGTHPNTMNVVPAAVDANFAQQFIRQNGQSIQLSHSLQYSTLSNLSNDQLMAINNSYASQPAWVVGSDGNPVPVPSNNAAHSFTINSNVPSSASTDSSSPNTSFVTQNSQKNSSFGSQTSQMNTSFGSQNAWTVGNNGSFVAQIPLSATTPTSNGALPSKMQETDTNNMIPMARFIKPTYETLLPPGVAQHLTTTADASSADAAVTATSGDGDQTGTDGTTNVIASSSDSMQSQLQDDNAANSSTQSSNSGNASNNTEDQPPADSSSPKNENTDSESTVPIDVSSVTIQRRHSIDEIGTASPDVPSGSIGGNPQKLTVTTSMVSLGSATSAASAHSMNNGIQIPIAATPGVNSLPPPPPPLATNPIGSPMPMLPPGCIILANGVVVPPPVHPPNIQRPPHLPVANISMSSFGSSASTSFHNSGSSLLSQLPTDADTVVPISKRTFASSNYKRFYVDAKAADFQYDLLGAVNNVLQFYASRLNPTLDADELEEDLHTSMMKIQEDAFENGKALKYDIAAVAEYLWTSATKHRVVKRMQLCSVLNAVIRDDIAREISAAAPVFRSLNTRRVRRENAGASVDVQSYPPDGETWRGGGFREEHRAFFNSIKGKKYRVPAFLATSKNRSIAAGFVFKASKSHPCAIWCIKFDKRGKDHPEYRVRHMTFVSKTLVPDEEEYLFAPYSVFTLQKVKWSSKLSKPHEFTILAAVDNKEEDENLPLAPWY